MQEINKRKKGGMTTEERKEYMKQYKKFTKGSGIFSNVADYLYVSLPFPVLVRKNFIEKDVPINEETLDIEETYCEIFSCGKKLKLIEKLCGRTCTKHMNNTEPIYHNGKL